MFLVKYEHTDRLAAVLQSFTTESMMKLHATISILSTMLLMGLHGATSPDNCRDKAHMDTMTTGVLCNYFIMLRTSI